MAEPLRVAIIGAGHRSRTLYGPILRALPDDVTLVSVWGRSADSARRLGEDWGVPWYTDLERLVRETAPQIGIVSVSYDANGQVGLMALEHGLHVLLETPIAHKLSEADAIIAAAQARGLKIEVAEQYHRYPIEQIKLKLLATGLFGRVTVSMNDFLCHAYHGVSVMRSYLGFEARPVQVTGAVRQYSLAPRGPYTARTETQEHGLVDFEDGRLGIFHYTNVNYGAPQRWWGSSRFLAERGMGVTEGLGAEVRDWLTLTSDDEEAPRPVVLEWRRERPGSHTLTALIARTGDPNIPVVRWDNPFPPHPQGGSLQWGDDDIAVAGCLMSLVNALRSGSEPTYGPHQARRDQEIIVALRQSSLAGGQPIPLPFDPAAQTV
ncbi:MAG: Gfo/Idh/MocA family oxidoreductase [Anaerolineales bacterium]|nr:Gfo/Idh/MocA family oxidoreductase [Anaerolineales bacterium]